MFELDDEEDTLVVVAAIAGECDSCGCTSCSDGSGCCDECECETCEEEQREEV
jgi:hypothetical protein